MNMGTLAIPVPKNIKPGASESKHEFLIPYTGGCRAWWLSGD